MIANKTALDFLQGLNSRHRLRRYGCHRSIAAPGIFAGQAHDGRLLSQAMRAQNPWWDRRGHSCPGERERHREPGLPPQRCHEELADPLIGSIAHSGRRGSPKLRDFPIECTAIDAHRPLTRLAHPEAICQRPLGRQTFRISGRTLKLPWRWTNSSQPPHGWTAMVGIPTNLLLRNLATSGNGVNPTLRPSSNVPY